MHPFLRFDMRIWEFAGLSRSPPCRCLCVVESFAGNIATTLSLMLALPAISLACKQAHFTYARAFSNANCMVGKHTPCMLQSFFNANCIVGEHTPCMLTVILQRQ